jgi:hypothetical protein
MTYQLGFWLLWAACIFLIWRCAYVVGKRNAKIRALTEQLQAAEGMIEMYRRVVLRSAGMNPDDYAEDVTRHDYQPRVANT